MIVRSKRIRSLLGGGLTFVGILCAGFPALAAEDSLPPVPAPESPSLHRPLDRASDFAPAGVLLDHTHERGDWTFAYRYERTLSDQLKVGEETLTTAEYETSYPGYASTPLSQLEEVHSFGVMYAPHERFTLAMILPFIQNRLERNVNGVFESQGSSGIGDALLIVLLPFIQKETQKTQFNVALSLPTGSIRVDDDQGNRLPYLMQHGSGSWDINWGLTYTGKHRWLAWGAQVESQYRIGSNDLDYELGAVYQASGWLAAEAGKWASVTARLGWIKTENIKGADPGLNPATSPLNDPRRQAGTRVEMGPGLNLLLPIMGGQRLSFEALFVLYQSVDGPQLAPDVKFNASWQWIF
ncbi:MAG: hypothetical protein OSB70_03395 [Myxococcota bacterium]|nr:hypothetical protein [Myxococcota bacterium]